MVASGGKFFLVPFKSASIVVTSGRKFFRILLSQRVFFALDPLQSVFFYRIWWEFVLDPFQSASIDATSSGKLVFGSF